MWKVDDAYLEALTNNHEMDVRIDVFTRGGGVRAADIPFESGQVTASMLTDVCRSGSFTVTRRLTDAGLLDPRKDRVRILTGAKGFPLIPIFIGRVVDTIPSDSGLVQVQVEDYGRDVIEAKFEQPWETDSRPGVQLIALEMVRLIQDVDPTFGVDISRSIDGDTPIIVWEDNRGQALDELAAAINCLWQPDRTGGFTIFPNPYNLTDLPPLEHVLTTGPSGTITAYQQTNTRDGVYNSVTVQIDRPDNAPPIRVTVRDTDPNSPFMWGGEFGKVNQLVRLQTPGGRVEAAIMARRLLNQYQGLARSWRITTPHFPLLDPGDVIGAKTVSPDTDVHVVESITYPLEAIDATSITTREFRQLVAMPT